MKTAQKQLTIRTYKPEDKARVLFLHEQGLRFTGTWNAETANAHDISHIEDVYLKGGGTFVVGEIDGNIIAMGGLRKVSEGVGEIMRMRVEPDFQRRGCGQAILGELEIRAHELGYRKLVLETTVIQTQAQAFYTVNGYKETKRIPFKSPDLETVLIHYEKEFERESKSEEADLGASRRNVVPNINATLAQVLGGSTKRI